MLHPHHCAPPYRSPVPTNGVICETLTDAVQLTHMHTPAFVCCFAASLALAHAAVEKHLQATPQTGAAERVNIVWENGRVRFK